MARQADLRAAIGADVLSQRIQPDELGGRWDQRRLAIAQAEVELGADQQDDIRLAQRRAPRLRAEQRVVGRQAAARRAVQEDWRAEPLGQGAQRRRRVIPPDRRAGEDHRALGLRQQRRRAGDLARVGLCAVGAARGRVGDDGFLGGDDVVQHVHRAFEEDRPVAACRRLAEAHRGVFGQPLRTGDRPRPLGDRGDEVHMPHLLQRAAVHLIERGGAAEDDDRAAALVGVGDAGHAVSHARASGQQRDARLAGDARPALGGVDGHLLVARIHHPDTLAHAAVIDRGDVAAAEGEDDLDAFALEDFGDQHAAVRHHILHGVNPLLCVVARWRALPALLVWPAGGGVSRTPAYHGGLRFSPQPATIQAPRQSPRRRGGGVSRLEQRV